MFIIKKNHILLCGRSINDKKKTKKPKKIHKNEKQKEDERS